MSALLLLVFTTLLHEAEVPGLSIARIERGKIASVRHYGVMNAETRQPVTDATVFESASLTKPLFAYAVMGLVKRGAIELDKPLIAYLPEPVSDERMKAITARMVLSHTTGFQNEVMPGDTLRLQFAPGEKFGYSGAGFLYLQRVVEHITRKPLPQLMRELVFEPLGMRDSSYVWLPSYEPRKAWGHSMGGSVRARRKPNVPTVATLHTTTRDYAKFVVAVMKDSRGMLEPQVDAAPHVKWGLGWALEETPRGQAFWHWGENHGEIHTFVMAYPNGDGVVVFTNSGNGHSIMPELVANTLGGEHPAFAFMGYDGYRAPVKVVLRDVLARGASAALANGAADSLTEAQINRIGYVLLEKKRNADAIAIFRLNVQRFPQSFNVYDSLGEAYAAAGDLANAIANYQRSLEVKALKAP
jgi:CubicO group peptidase (beta-lactamase class C family)